MRPGHQDHTQLGTRGAAALGWGHTPIRMMIIKVYNY